MLPGSMPLVSLFPLTKKRVRGTSSSWFASKGAWLIHPVLIFCGKLLIDAIPGMTQDVSWTIVNLSYITVGRCLVRRVVTLFTYRTSVLLHHVPPRYRTSF